MSSTTAHLHLEATLVVACYPLTLIEEDPRTAFSELLAALEELGDDHAVVLTLPHADTGGRALIDMVQPAAAQRNDLVAVASLGQRRYWSCLHHAGAVVGNS